MKQCPTCKLEFEEPARFCPFDGQALASPPKDELIGTMLDGKYYLKEKIGEGGMGKVYSATHIHLDTTVAVKVLHPDMAADETALQRFRREARAAGQLRHPNAVAVTDFGVTRESGMAYLVMEFLEGLPLSKRISEQKQLSFQEIFIVTKQACSAVHTAHLKGIVHRDLKPENIWLLESRTGPEHVKVLDFGIARLKGQPHTGPLLEKGKPVSTLVGTPAYMSPEQCLGEELDARSDIYSLGIILYEMLTGEIPFKGPTPLAVAFQQVSEPPRPPRESRPDISYEVQGVVLQALAKSRDARQESALLLARQLEAALYASGIEVKRSRTNTP